LRQEQINSPAKFANIWGKISCSEQLDLLRSTPLTTLDKFFKWELPSTLLSDMTTFLNPDVESDEWLGHLLKIVINSNRFGINKLFLSPEETQFYKTLIRRISSPEKDELLQGFGF
jgi:Potential Monad-binding region of RPAP3